MAEQRLPFWTPTEAAQVGRPAGVQAECTSFAGKVAPKQMHWNIGQNRKGVKKLESNAHGLLSLRNSEEFFKL